MMCVPDWMRPRVEARGPRTRLCGFGFRSEIRKACVVDQCTCLGIDEHGRPKGSNFEMRDGILKFRIGYTC